MAKVQLKIYYAEVVENTQRFAEENLLCVFVPCTMSLSLARDLNHGLRIGSFNGQMGGKVNIKT